MDSSGNAAVSAVSSYSTPSRAMPQQKTVVQFNVFSVEEEALGDEGPVAVTICNIFGLKDIILGNKPLPNGDFFYWPARMLYAHQVAAVMDTGYSRKYSLFQRSIIADFEWSSFDRPFSPNQNERQSAFL